MPVTTEQLQNELADSIKKVRQTVQLLHSPDGISQRQRKQIDTINKKLLSAAEKQAKAAFAVRIAERLADDKRKELDNSAAKRAARRRREHLAFTLGCELLRIQHFERGFIANLLNGVHNKHVYNKIIKELHEFCGLAIMNCQYTRQEIVEAQKELLQ